MNLQITGHHVEITPAIRDYVLSKLDRINRHFENVIDVNVTLTVQKLDQKIEANVHLSGKDIHVILDNYAAHKHPKVRAWLGRHERFTFHFMPASCSWLWSWFCRGLSSFFSVSAPGALPWPSFCSQFP